MATIVLVHGIAHELMSAVVVEAGWLPALVRGVRNAGFPVLAAASSGFPGEPPQLRRRFAVSGPSKPAASASIRPDQPACPSAARTHSTTWSTSSNWVPSTASQTTSKDPSGDSQAISGLRTW
jgi:hypothetical protein